jgi:hypothetical protein
MENTKRSRKVVNGLVCLTMLGLIGFIVYQHHQIKTLSQALQSANESSGKQTTGQNGIAQKAATPNKALASKGQNVSDDLSYQLTAAEEELDSAHAQLSDTLVKDAKDEKNIMLSPSDMLKTPEGRKKLRSALKNGLDETYSALFKQLDLSPEKLARLKELLADQSIASMELQNEIQGASPTEENRNNLRQRQEDLKKQDDAALAALLGTADYQTYKDYNDRFEERMMVRMFTQTLGDDDSLTGDQKKALIESMYKARTDAFSQTGEEQNKVMFPSDWNEEGIAKMMAINDRVYDGYTKSAEATLSASQTTQFKEYLKKNQAMMKASLKQQARMTGGQSTQGSTEADGDEETGDMIVIVR